MRGQTSFRRIIGVVITALLLAGGLNATASAHHTKKHGGTTTPPPPPPPAVSTLVLYDVGGDWKHVSELHGIMAANLAGHFGTVTSKPVTTYTAGEMRNHTAVIYVGSTWDEPIPDAFLTDVIAETRPVIWVNRNIWQLASKVGFTEKYGWHWNSFNEDDIQQIEYKGQILKRDANNPRGIMDYTILNQAKINVLAQAIRPDGTKFPWALRSENLTYIGESPFSFVGERDRYLIFSDILFNALAPNTPERHRAMVRLEDVGCDGEPSDLRAVADYLYSQSVPFSFGVYPVYKNPLGTDNNGVAETVKLSDRACAGVVSAIKYMQARGGTMIAHGYTHQFGAIANPYNGRSGDDFEFYMAHVDENDYVRYDGPVPGDSYEWARGRMQLSTGEFARAGLTVPTIWEFPHYGASAVDYKAAASLFTTAYERRLYFGGFFSNNITDHSKMAGQFFPYPVRDVYGTKVLPENIGNIETESFNHHPITLSDELIARARANLVVRDGFASFFYHPHLGTEQLRLTVQGIKALGYQFVSPTTL